jgi:RNA polymerase sigma-70 factor, ECF subfamily
VTGDAARAAVDAAVASAFREEWGKVVATLIRTTGDWDLAEECAQDAFALALQRWPRDGIPGRPGAWADHRGAQPRHRRAAPQGGRRGQAPGGGRHAVL